MQNKLEIKYLSLDEIVPYVNNAKVHSQEQIDQLKASIKEFATPYKLETYLHKKYKDYNTHGEWFKFKKSEVDEVINCIESIKGVFNG